MRKEEHGFICCKKGAEFGFAGRIHSKEEDAVKDCSEKNAKAVSLGIEVRYEVREIDAAKIAMIRSTSGKTTCTDA